MTGHNARLVLPDAAPGFRRLAVLKAAGVVAGLVAGGLLAFTVSARLTAVDVSHLAPVTPPPVASPSASPRPLADVGRLVLDRVVTVETDRASEEALGTGWLFDNHGDFVTNAHVVAGALTVRLTDRAAHTHVAVVLGTDAALDIAVLRSSDGFAGTPLPVETRPVTSVPVPVVDVASSRATGHDDITTASLTGTGEDVPLEPGEVQPGSNAPSVYHDMLALAGAKVYQGNSGGPVLDGAGRVVGILTLASPSQPTSFAIPIASVLSELTQLAAKPG